MLGPSTPAAIVGHLVEYDAGSDVMWWIAFSACWMGWLAAQNHVVLVGWAPLRTAVRTTLAALAAVTLVAVSVPSADAAIPDPTVGLPDLISDPPIIRLTKPVLGVNGEPMLVMAFDGFLRNIGEGMLDVSGNPQISGDVKQRVYNGTEWEPVATPTITYETNDGHNHFHLVSAAEYTLWDDARSDQLGTAAKVGFCLVDFEAIDERSVPFYGLDRFAYCAVDQPDTTELRMGISPGWRDTYDASTTLQWVDVSDVGPGRYWISAVIDPENQIVESDETNNDHVFSTTSFEVPGYRARPLSPVSPGEPITLKADTYGTVGDVAFVIAEPPTNGTLDVPSMVDLFDPVVTYEPRDGFVGTDRFRFYAHDTGSAFPNNPVPVTVSIDVTNEFTASSSQPRTEDLDAFEFVADLPSRTTIKTWQPLTAALVVDAPPDMRWYSLGLPPGLRIDVRTGQIIGTPTSAGQFKSTIVGVADSGDMAGTVTWTVATDPESLPALIHLNGFSTPSPQSLGVEVGFVRSETGAVSYEGSGFPLGTTVATDQPLIIGIAQEVGQFDIEISRFVDGQLTDSVSTAWTVRPVARPAFVL